MNNVLKNSILKSILPSTENMLKNSQNPIHSNIQDDSIQDTIKDTIQDTIQDSTQDSLLIATSGWASIMKALGHNSLNGIFKGVTGFASFSSKFIGVIIFIIIFSLIALAFLIVNYCWKELKIITEHAIDFINDIFKQMLIGWNNFAKGLNTILGSGTVPTANPNDYTINVKIPTFLGIIEMIITPIIVYIVQIIHRLFNFI
jgi:hypothetical protein